MGLFDKIQTDDTGSLGTFTQQAKAFATLDLNSIFKQGGQAVVSLISNAVAFFKDVFGSSNCNDQDRILVERMWDQIPGMAILLSDMGYLDRTIGEYLRESPDNIYGWMQSGRPKGAEPCNSLIGPARILFTILFGVRIKNVHSLDGLENGVDGYYAHENGGYQYDIPREAVERAVMLKQTFFNNATYNNQQWDLNLFQAYPLVAPIPDPNVPGQLFTGEFLGVKVVNGYAIGTAIPVIPIDPVPGTQDPIQDPTDTVQQPGQSFFDRAILYVQSNPFEALLIGVAAGTGAYLLWKETKKRKRHDR